MGLPSSLLSVTKSVLMWCFAISLIASDSGVSAVTEISGEDMIFLTWIIDERRFSADTLFSMSLSVTMPTGSPAIVTRMLPTPFSFILRAASQTELSPSIVKTSDLTKLRTVMGFSSSTCSSQNVRE